MKKPRVHRLLAGILCAAMLTQNLTVTSLASEPEPAVVQETEAEAGLEERTDLEENTEPEAVEEESEAEEPEAAEEAGEAEPDTEEEAEQEDVFVENEDTEPEDTDGTILDEAVCVPNSSVAAHSAAKSARSSDFSTLFVMQMDIKYQQTEARKMLDIVNEFRKGEDAWCWDETDTEKVKIEDLEDLEWDYNLEKIAMLRAAECALYPSHRRPDGTMCITAFDRGDETYSYSVKGENIAGAATTARNAFLIWKEQNATYAGQGHRRNMLGIMEASKGGFIKTGFNAIGIGHVVFQGTHFWTMVLGTTKKVCKEEIPAVDDVQTDMIVASTDYVSSLKMSNTEMEVPYGSVVLRPLVPASIKLSNAANVRIYLNWESDDPTIADEKNGMLRALKVGKTTFRSTFCPETKYKQDLEAAITVVPAELAEEDITLEQDYYEYSGEEIEPAVTVRWNDQELVEGTDYTVIYENNRSGGTAAAVVEGIGNFGGRIEKKFTIYCEHTYGQGVVTRRPTCTEEGVRSYVCTICDAVKTEAIEALGHTYITDPAVEATCTESGLTEGKHCSVCHEVFEEQKVVPALGHDYVDGICSRCQAVKPVLTAEDFIVSKPSALIYDGTEKPVDVKTVQEITDVGKITINYYQNGERLESIPVDAGTYEVRLSVEESDTYYKSEDLYLPQWEYTIHKAEATVRCTDVTVRQGKALPKKYEYEVSGLIGTEQLGFIPEIDCETADSSAIGTYKIIPSGPAELKNYKITYEPGTLYVIEKGDAIAQGKIDAVYGKITWIIDADGELTVEGRGDLSEDNIRINNSYERIPWYPYKDTITSARIKVTGMKNAASLLYSCKNMTSVDLSEFDTSQVTNMYHMFSWCENLEELDLSSMDTAKVKNMKDVFYGCAKLKTLDLSNFDTTNVTDMNSMFGECTSLEEINVSSFHTENVTDMAFMFYECKKLKYLDVSSFRIEKVKTVLAMFDQCTSLTGLDLSGFDFQNVTRVARLIDRCNNLTYIRTPKNVPEISNQTIELPKNYIRDKWYDLEGNEVTTIQTGLAESVTLYKNNKEVLKQPIGLVAEKEKTTYEWGETLSLDDLNVAVRYLDESRETVSDYTTNADSIDMSEPGEKKLHIVYGDMTADVKIAVIAKQLDAIKVSFSPLPEYTYDGEEKKPVPEAYYDEQLLVPDVDYTISYENNRNAGYGIVQITGKDKYEGSLKKEFLIKKAVLTITAPDRTIAQGVRLTGNGNTCRVEGLKGSDRFVIEPTYTCMISTDEVGIYPNTIVTSGADAGDNYEIVYVNGTLTIIERQTQDLAVKELVQTEYTGSKLKPLLKVYDKETGALLKNGKDYKISYYNNINADPVKAAGGISDNQEKDDETGFDPELPYAVVTGKGNYQGVLYVNFHILPVDLERVTLKYKDHLTANEKKAQKVISSMKYKKALKEGVDYTVEGNVIPAGAAGTFLLKIEGTGNYTGTIERSIYVADKTKLLKYAVITVDKASKKQVYDGKEKTLAFSVRMGKVPLIEGTDYSVSYENNNAVGKATMTITGMGEYLGTKSVTFQLTGTKFTAKNLKVVADNESGETVDISRYTAEYSGKEIEPEHLTVTLQNGSDPEKILTEGIDYELTYKNNVNAGKATVTIKAGKDSVYEGSVSKTFRITQASLDKTEKELQQTVVYEKAGARPELTLTYGGLTLQEGKDYTVKCMNNLTAEAESNPPIVIVTGKENYTGTWSANYSILKKSLKDGLADGTITVDVKTTAFTNSENADQTYRPAVKVYDGKKALAAGKDYTVSYRNNTNGELNEDLSNGEVVIEAVETGSYKESIIVALPIYEEKISSSTIYTIIEPAAYTGGQVRPQIQIYYGTAQAVKYAKILETTAPEELNALGLELLREQVDYKLSYGANIAAGKNKGSVKITGTGWYGGSASVKFTINAKQL